MNKLTIDVKPSPDIDCMYLADVTWHNDSGEDRQIGYGESATQTGAIIAACKQVIAYLDR